MSTVATLANGIWSWWVRPLIVVDGRHAWVSSIARLGTNRVHRVNLDTSAVDVLPLGGQDRSDDHNAGAIAYHPDRATLLVFYARHAQDDYIRWRHVNRSTLNVSADERRLDFPGRVTYAQILQQPGGPDDRLVLLCRVDATWQYRMTWDWGATWTPPRILLNAAGTIGQPYILSAVDGTDPGHVHLAVAGNPASTDYRPVLGLSIGLHSGSVRTLGGGRLGDLDDPSGPQLTPDRLDVLHDPGPGRRVRLLDLAGWARRPWALVAEWEGDGPAEYRALSPCDDPAWRLPTGREFGHTRAARYVGGAAWTPTGGVITSRQDPPDVLGGTWHVEHWPDLEAAPQLVTSSTIPQVRPVPVAHPDGGSLLGVLDVRDYTSYSTYDANIILHRLT